MFGKTIVNIAEAIRARGLVEQEGGGEMKEFLAHKRTAYLGIDPTADSLQVGHLVPVLLMKRLADAGHDIIFVVGGGTGMIGDPRESGERVLLDEKVIEKNTRLIHRQLVAILKNKPTVVNNASWLSKLTVIEFLRDVAKHFTVNQLIKRDLIKKRLDTEDPLSFTEFSYSLLQAYDFWHLYKEKGVDLQIGGSDQWTNIISGIDLIRRMEGGSAYALTMPIIIDKKSGRKFGKSEGNALWLDPHKTPPFEFYQFWVNVADEDVGEYLKIFTFLQLPEIESLMRAHGEEPHKRLGQKKLAFEVTSIVHGKDAAQGALRVSQIVYGWGVLESLEKQDIATLRKEMPGAALAKRDAERMTIVDALVAAKLAESRSDARRFVEGKSVYLNNTLVETPEAILSSEHFVQHAALLRCGKKVALLSVS